MVAIKLKMGVVRFMQTLGRKLHKAIFGTLGVLFLALAVAVSYLEQRKKSGLANRKVKRKAE